MTGRPFLSVIVPVYDGAHLLPDTLGALRRSHLDGDLWELVVVDDASTDDSALVASRWADTVVRLPGGPRGPAYARNRAAEASRGEVLVFVDADVRIAPGALGRVERHFREDPELAAAFGSYDDQPPAPGVVSRYRNLLHHYHHHLGAGEATTFWAGLGAVRAVAFRDVEGFDEWHYRRPQIEDIELGRRLRRAGYRIVLDPTIQGTHLKRWTLRQVLATDLLHRGIPWMRLILAEGSGSDTLNVKPKEKVCVGLVGVGLAALALSPAAGSWILSGVGVGCLALVVTLNLGLYRYLSRGRGFGFGLAVVPLHLAYYVTSGLAFVLGHLLHRLGKAPRVPEGSIEDGSAADGWPPARVRPRDSIWDLGAGAGGG